MRIELALTQAVQLSLHFVGKLKISSVIHPWGTYLKTNHCLREIQETEYKTSPTPSGIWTRDISILSQMFHHLSYQHCSNYSWLENNCSISTELFIQRSIHATVVTRQQVTADDDKNPSNQSQVKRKVRDVSMFFYSRKKLVVFVVHCNSEIATGRTQAVTFARL